MITPASGAEVGAPRRVLLKAAKAVQAAEEAEAEGKGLLLPSVARVDYKADAESK
jgi:hypothetical protein